MRVRNCALATFAVLGLCGCPQKEDSAAKATPSAASTPPLPACPAGGFKGDTPTAYCLEKAPSGCQAQSSGATYATLQCTNGTISMEWTDPLQDSLDGFLASLASRTSDKTTKILEQGTPSGGKGKYMVYQRADQKGITNSISYMMGKKYVWTCQAQVMDSQTAERDKLIGACRTLKEI